VELTPACNEASFGKAPREARAGAGAHGAAFCSSVGSTGAAHKKVPALSVLTAEAAPNGAQVSHSADSSPLLQVLTGIQF